MRPLLGCTTLLLALAPWATAAAPPASLRESDRLDYLFLGSDRPTLIRLHVRVGDKPYDAPWDDFMDELFAWFDKDKDGSLSESEVARLPSANSLLDQALGNIGLDAGGVPLGAIDANKDGNVSKEEFRAFYRKSGFSRFKFVTNTNQAITAKQVNEVVFERLDKAGGGILTAEKVAGLYEKLRALDENEDEMLDLAELTTRPDPAGGYSISSRVGGPRVAPAIESALLEIEPGREAALVERVMDKYDRNKDGKLTPGEIGLPPASFARLDADKNGSLDAAELRAYLTSEPDLVLRLQVGTAVTRKGLANLFPAPRLVVVNEKTLGAGVKKTIRRAGSDSVAVRLGDTRMALQAAARDDQVRRFDNAKRYHLQRYDAVVGKKGYVEPSDLTGGQPYLLQIFPQADKNVDGKLTRVELIDWLDFVATGRDAKVTLTAYDLGRSIFPFLDADGDGRLSLREMKTAWSRLRPLAKEGKVARDDIPRSLRIIVRQGQLTDNNILPVTGGYGRTATRSARRADVPAWFRKMDKNDDGDVSPREWLGTGEEFAAIDADGDGLISAEEAIAFEARKKTKDEE